MIKTSRPNDVRFSFPKVGPRLELWTNSEILLAATDYFSPVNQSSFALSSSTRKTKRAKTSGPTRIELGEFDDDQFDDSDDEADMVLLNSIQSDEAFKGGSQAVPDADLDVFAFAEVEVSAAAYSTYHAIVLFLITSQINFAPLRSSFDADSPTELVDASVSDANSSTRPLTLFSYHLANPSLPLPVSPKSVYRLATLLKLEHLQALALDAFKERLTITNVAEELFSDAAVQFEEIKLVAMEFATTKWAVVKKSAKWKAVVAKVAEKESPLARIGFELLGKTKTL